MLGLHSPHFFHGLRLDFNAQADIAPALQLFTHLVSAHYGAELHGLYLYGSRARGDHSPQSDADIAVVLSDGADKSFLIQAKTDVLLEHFMPISPFAVKLSHWGNPRTSPYPRLIWNMQEDAIALNETLWKA